MNETEAPISPENKFIARHVAALFGGTPRVDEYVNDSKTQSVAILSCRDRPMTGVSSYSTIKLSDYPMKWGDGEFPTRLELAGVCMTVAESFPNVLASAAFTIMQSDAVYHPGTVIPDLNRKYFSSSGLPHIYLTVPFVFGNSLQTLDCQTKKVSWLLAMPISDAEYRYLSEHGRKALELLLEDQQIDVADPNRSSTL
jgi:antitoxin YqcF